MSRRRLTALALALCIGLAGRLHAASPTILYGSGKLVGALDGNSQDISNLGAAGVGSLAVGLSGSITLEGLVEDAYDLTISAGTWTAARKLTIGDADITLDQDVATTASPTFAAVTAAPTVPSGSKITFERGTYDFYIDTAAITDSHKTLTLGNVSITLDQNVATTASPTFAAVTAAPTVPSGSKITFERGTYDFYIDTAAITDSHKTLTLGNVSITLDQDVATTASPTFAAVTAAPTVPSGTKITFERGTYDLYVDTAAITDSHKTVTIANADGIVGPISLGSLVAWISSTGSDTTGAVGNPAAPYATAQAAYDDGARTLVLMPHSSNYGALVLAASSTRVTLVGFGTSRSALASVTTADSGDAVQIRGNGRELVSVGAVTVGVAATLYDLTTTTIARSADGAATAYRCTGTTITLTGLTDGEAGANATLYDSDYTTVTSSGKAGAAGTTGPGGTGGAGGTVTLYHSRVTTLVGLGGAGGAGGVNEDTGQDGGTGGAGGTVTLYQLSKVSTITATGGTGGIGGDGANGDGTGGTGGAGGTVNLDESSYCATSISSAGGSGGEAIAGSASGAGGQGGTVTLTFARAGAIVAAGGAAGSNGSPPGNGGDGGTVTLASTLTGAITVSGGSGTTGGADGAVTVTFSKVGAITGCTPTILASVVNSVWTE